MNGNVVILLISHVLVSLIAIAAGIVVSRDMIHGRRRDGWHDLFLSTTLATSVTGFFFPITQLTPGLIFGVISLVALAIAGHARYRRVLTGRWHAAYIITAMLAFYLNFFVLVAQAFQKVPFLTALAPTQNSPAFGVTQLVVLMVFVLMTVKALRGPVMVDMPGEHAST